MKSNFKNLNKILTERNINGDYTNNYANHNRDNTFHNNPTMNNNNDFISKDLKYNNINI